MVRLGPRAILRLAVPLVFISFPAFAIWTRRAGSGGAEPDEDANPLPPGHETPTRPADVLEPTIEIHSPEDASLPARGASKQRLWGFKEVDDLEQELGQRGEAAKPPEPEAASKDSEDATAVKADAGQKGGIPGERPAPVDVPHSLNMPRFKFGQAEKCRFPHLAVAVKTGRGVAHRRLPAVLSTYVPELCNVLLITDGGGSYNESELDPRYADTRIFDAKNGQALVGTGAKDFIVALGKLRYRVFDVTGALFRSVPPDARDPDAKTLQVAELEVRHRDRWEPGVWEEARRKADDLETAFEWKRKEERKEKRLKEGGRRRRLRKRGDGGTRQGWESDQAKFIPGLVELWNRFPDAKWFVMVDDDSFAFVPAMYLHLSTFFKHEEPYYIGKAMRFSGCYWEPRADDRETYLRFASGAGFFLSRGAMLRALPYARAGAAKTRDCWAGDARVAIFLYDAGIRLWWGQEVIGRMHIGPQGLWHSFGRACDPVLVYHLVPPAAYPRIWRVASKPESAGGFVTNADMWRLFYDTGEDAKLREAEGGFEWDTNRGDMDALVLSKAPPGTTEAAFLAESEKELKLLLAGRGAYPHHTTKVLLAVRALPNEVLSSKSPARARVALALRCLAACRALPRIVDLPGTISTPLQPIPEFHNRTATPFRTLGNHSPASGPCVMWTLNPSGECYLKTGFSNAAVGSAPGHVSGIAEGAGKAYSEATAKGPAGKRCGWAVGRPTNWDTE